MDKNQRMFRVMGKEDCPREIDIRFVLPHGRQAKINHNQTVNRLNERGGLTPSELIAVLEDRQYTRMPENVAASLVNKFLEDFFICCGCDEVYRKPPGEVDYGPEGQKTLFCIYCARE